jgi:ATP/maltotriose-dependent transcriptional regulator MalT
LLGASLGVGWDGHERSLRFEGWGQREIGSALFLSINTVKGYAKSLYRKLDVTTRQEAVERGRALNLI